PREPPPPRPGEQPPRGDRPARDLPRRPRRPTNPSYSGGGMALSNRHRDTIEKIFDRPSSGNVEWGDVLALLEAVGDVVEEPNGRYRVTLGAETEVVDRPHGKDA